jgi:hypothetical protein
MRTIPTPSNRALGRDPEVLVTRPEAVDERTRQLQERKLNRLFSICRLSSLKRHSVDLHVLGVRDLTALTVLAFSCNEIFRPDREGRTSHEFLHVYDTTLLHSFMISRMVRQVRADVGGPMGLPCD